MQTRILSLFLIFIFVEDVEGLYWVFTEDVAYVLQSQHVHQVLTEVSHLLVGQLVVQASDFMTRSSNWVHLHYSVRVLVTVHVLNLVKMSAYLAVQLFEILGLVSCVL